MIKKLQKTFDSKSHFDINMRTAGQDNNKFTASDGPFVNTLDAQEGEIAICGNHNNKLF